MKKTMTILLALSMLLACFAGCGVKALKPVNIPAEAAAPTEETAVNEPAVNEPVTEEPAPTESAATKPAAAEPAAVEEAPEAGEADPVTVEPVTITAAIAVGTPVYTEARLTVADSDDDGALTVNDALIAAHEAGFAGGAAAGYDTAVGDYGLSVTKLWGEETIGVGYYLNDNACWSLTDPIAEGDYLMAFLYIDTLYYSDVYCFFDLNTVETTPGSTVTLTLFSAGYDEAWNPVAAPLAGAQLLVNGDAVDAFTAEDGSVTLTVENGETLISAACEGMVLVPPVCLVSAQ